MTINGHLILLVVAAGLFARVWSTNDRQRPPAVWRTPNHALSTSSPPQPASVEAECEIAAVAVSTESSAAVAVEEFWTADTCPIPLPAGIRVGAYRVVDDTGRVARLDVTALKSDPVAENDAVDSEIQTTTTDSRHWYFIRLVPAAARVVLDCDVEVRETGVPSIAGTEPVRTACLNRKFDFSGYEEAVPSEEPQDTTDFRPESPELPVVE